MGLEMEGVFTVEVEMEMGMAVSVWAWEETKTAKLVHNKDRMSASMTCLLIRCRILLEMD